MMSAVAVTVQRATARGSAGKATLTTGRQTPPGRPTIEDLRRRLMNPSELRCEFCGATFETRRNLGGHRAWCSKNPNRRTKRSGKAGRPPAAKRTDGHGPARTATHDALPDPPGSTRDAAGRMHRADNRPDRLTLTDASIADLEGALIVSLLDQRRAIDAKLRALGYVED